MVAENQPELLFLFYLIFYSNKAFYEKDIVKYSWDHRILSVIYRQQMSPLIVNIFIQGASRSAGKVHHHPPASLPLAAAGFLVIGSPPPSQMGWLQEEGHPHST